MKLEDLARPGLVALGVAGMAATGLLGFAAGWALSRDPEAARRVARRLARGAVRGFESASLLAAQAREELGDIWAEVREEVVADVDHTDFERAAARAATGTAAAGAAAGQAAAGRDPAEPATAAKKMRSTARRKRATEPRQDAAL